jgi:electron transfer flavoprotein-quinone oxidoreductase
MALISGRLAAETILDARRQRDYSAKTLTSYVERLKQSPIIKDLYAQRRLSNWYHEHPRFFSDYPELAVELLRDHFTLSGQTKGEVRRGIVRKFRRRVGRLRGLWIFWRFKRAMFGK